MDNSDNQENPIDKVYQEKLLDILSRKQDIETSLNDFKKQQEDYLTRLDVTNINIPFTNDTIQIIDTSTRPLEFNNSTKTFTISRGNNGSFPRFRFRPKPENKIDGTIFRKIKITFRWLGTEKSYNYHNLNNKKWCIGSGPKPSGCRSDSSDMPPVTGEYISYIINITDNDILNNKNIEWMNWKGPDMGPNQDSLNVAKWEFKEIIFIQDHIKIKTLLDTKINEIKNKINLLKNDILELKKRDNSKTLTNEWNNLIKKSVDLNNSYNNLLNEYNSYNTNIGSTNTSGRISKSKNLEYFGFMCSIIIMIYLIIKIMITQEETAIENIIFTLMIIIIIYYIYKLYASYVGSTIEKITPPILYKWIPESIRNFFYLLIDAINNKFLNFDYVR